MLVKHNFPSHFERALPAPIGIGSDLSPKAFRMGVTAIWLLTASILLWMSFDRIGLLVMWDPDDYLRLLQVRDLLAGQSYFDVTQYRIDPPHGVPMHWSRLPDLPIAGAILLLKPILGATLAERTAISVVPLATFAGSLAAVASATRRLAGRRAALAAAMLAATTPALLFHILPMRIDHHGLQTMLGLVAVASCFDRRPRRGGVFAGVAVAAWLAISIEALPMVTAISALLACRFIFAADDLGPWRCFRAFAAAMGIGGIVIFASTHDLAAWRQPWCDAFGPAWFGPLVLSPLAAALLVRRGFAHSAGARVALLILAGIAGGGVLALTAPACLAGPFAALDPVVTHYWYENVLEGMPVWRQSASDQIALALFPPIGLAGAALAWRASATRAAARDWLALLALGCAAFLLALLVQRAGGFAHAMALPGAGWLLVRILGRIGDWRRIGARVLASAMTILLLSPAGATLAGQAALGLVTTTPPKEPAKPASACVGCDPVAAIAALPRSYILAGLDITPRLLVNTPHLYAGSSHHRGAAGIRRVLDSFLGAPEIAHRIMRARGMRYVLIDRDGQEAEIYRKAAPTGLMARLVRNDPPAWLEPVPLGPGPLRMWRRVA